MKIKELHLRNIASIERADIDFEKDLFDFGENSPAGIFLISGDTGAGKSAILDGISMALYKKTPRVAGVQNVKQNDFINSNGERVSINSIEQYTRLGISPKDDCYSEIVFEGNDGVTYHARLTLGLMLGNTDRATGKRPLKYRTPLWTVKKAGGEWTKCAKGDTTISDAVGLTFEQFGRIAMLAQGQFASFLTGNKAEREAILEQLTNTERFSTYGVAIKNLFDRARKARDNEDTLYQMLKGNALTPEQLEAKTAEAALLEKTKAELDAAVENLSRRRNRIEEVARTEASIVELNARKQVLAERLDNEESIRMRRLVALWDSTVAQRRSLVTLRDRRTEKAKAEAALAALQDEFKSLTADLIARRDNLKRLEQSIAATKEMIDRSADRADLYADSGRIVDSLRSMAAMREEVKILSRRISEYKTLTPTLEEAATRASASANDARLKAENRQKEIETLTGRRQALKPDETADLTTRCRNRRDALRKLSDDMTKLSGDMSERETLKTEIGAEKDAITAMKTALDEANKRFATAKADDEASRNLLATMEMSIGDLLTGLRHKLAEDHADTCPLCGGAIASLPDSSEFRSVLIPLETRRAETSKCLAEAQQARDRAMELLNRSTGQLAAKNKQLTALTATISRETNAVGNQASALGLDNSTPLEPQITEAADTVEKELERLAGITIEAEAIQRDINALIAKKKIDDSEALKAADLKAVADKKLNDNLNEISKLQTLEKEKTDKITATSESLEPLLKPRYENWDTDEGAAALERDSRQYSEWLRKFEADTASRDKATTLVDSLEGIFHTISLLRPEWKRAETPREIVAGNPAKRVTDLYGRVAALSETLTKADAEIERQGNILAEYYKTAGMSEERLAAIDSRPDEVAVARKTLADLSAELKSRIDAIAEAERRVATLRANLLLDADAPLPDIAAVDAEIAALGVRTDETARALGALIQELESNRHNSLKLVAQGEKLAAATAVFEKWDRLNSLFGGTRLRTLVQTYILQPLLNNANIYLSQITDRYTLTCSEDNEQLSIFVLDRYNKNHLRSATVLSGGERFMVSLALSLALSSLNRPDMNVNILFIDEGFGTLDEKSLDSVMATLEKLRQLAGQSNRRVGIISHREELIERIPSQIRVTKKGEGRSSVTVTNTL